MDRKKWFAAGAVGVLAAGLLIGFYLIRNRPRPEMASVPRAGRVVRTSVLKKVDKTFWITAYGTVRPKTEITLVPEVSGRIIRRSPGFRSGGFIPKGVLLFEIDPASYKLAAAQRRAQLAQLEADIAHLRQEEKNHRAALAINQRQLKIARKALERNKRLRRQRVISAGQLDTSLQATLQQEQSVQTSRNALALIPSQIAQKEAALLVTRAQLEEALLNLGRTKVRAPFDGRVRETSLEVGDFARAGEPIGKIHDVSVLEVPVSLPVEDVRWALRRGNGPAAFPRSQEEVQQYFPRAEILWTRFGQTFRWDGQVSVVEAGLDETTRALTLVVEVPEPRKNWQPGKHPPLIVGMFVRARIEGVTVSGVFVIPRAALHGKDEVYIMKAGRLDIRRVQIIRKSENEAVIRDGIQEGERLILSIIPAPVPGMRLRAAEDSSAPFRRAARP